VIAYLDSSVILRVVLGWRGRLKDWRKVREGVVSALAEVECLRTLDRLRLRGAITDRDLSIRRTLDAIHLATAMLWRESSSADLAFATHDAALGTAARASGFTVLGI